MTTDDADFDAEFTPTEGGWFDWPWYRKVAAWFRYAPVRNARAVVLVVRQWACLRLGIRPPMSWVVQGEERAVSGWDRTDEWHGQADDGCIRDPEWRKPNLGHGLKYERDLTFIWETERGWDFEVGRTYLWNHRP